MCTHLLDCCLCHMHQGCALHNFCISGHVCGILHATCSFSKHVEHIGTLFPVRLCLLRENVPHAPLGYGTGWMQVPPASCGHLCLRMECLCCHLYNCGGEVFHQLILESSTLTGCRAGCQGENAAAGGPRLPQRVRYIVYVCGTCVREGWGRIL